MELNCAYLVLGVVVAVCLGYLLTRRKNDYFQKKSIRSLSSGIFYSIVFKKKSVSDLVNMIYEKFPEDRVVGTFDPTGPQFMLLDPELIKTIVVKNFDHFADRRPSFWNPNAKNPNTILNRTLFTLAGERWRNMRATLSPAFTGSKMRQMFQLVLECSLDMAQHYRQELATVESKEYDIKDMFSRFTNDVIATCAFGIKVNSLKDPNNDFYVNGKKMTHFHRFSVLLRMMAIIIFPRITDALGVEIIDKEQQDYLSALILDAIHERETKKIIRLDMIHLLMEARKGTLKNQLEQEHNEAFATVQESEVGQRMTNFQMTDVDMVAQCSIFFTAGFDTVSTCLTFLIYELTLNPEIQQRLYEEVLQTEQELDGRPLDYDTLQKMKYMDMCVSESLRLWAPIPMVDRLCIRDYQVDDRELNFVIDKGTSILIPIHALHRDARYFPDPEKFDPERFSEANKANINLGAYIPFGTGPRNCIGSRFALMEVKAIVYHMLLQFSFVRTENTPVPMSLLRGLAAMGSERDVMIALKLRK
ncbi:cytochrome P450 9e2-like [Sabethes cyaneus]|uniref:cytochrome P450 9e2-like n=1 Tax=Sabethes cyaneus TaxID=53552 RepID=UPI00237EE86B|nr:cytochrome P450 9e2-like [Sabethes cyaneus]